MVSVSNFVSILGATLAIIVGIFISPIPQNLGFYRFLTSKIPEFVGMIPLFHDKTEWQFTYEELYKNCDTISGQTALVTGANSGVGYETARALAKCGVDVTLACRNAERCSIAAEEIKKESMDNGYQNDVSTMIVDTSSLQSVQTFSNDFLTKHKDGSLDMLYLNAGMMKSGRNSSDNKLALSKDGIELVFATNYLGHHLMYRLLEPLLLNSKMARVIQTSSNASYMTFKYKVATRLESLNNPTTFFFTDLKNYGQSKLAQILWTKHLTKRLEDSKNIFVNVCHPGAVNTPLVDKVLPAFLIPLVNIVREKILWSREEGALTQLYLGVATDALATKNIRGKYFHPQAQEVVNPLSLDEQLQSDLWEFSEELISEFL